MTRQQQTETWTDDLESGIETTPLPSAPAPHIPDPTDPDELAMCVGGRVLEMYDERTLDMNRQAPPTMSSRREHIAYTERRRAYCMAILSELVDMPKYRARIAAAHAAS